MINHVTRETFYSLTYCLSGFFSSFEATAQKEFTRKKKHSINLTVAIICPKFSFEALIESKASTYFLMIFDTYTLLGKGDGRE